MWVSRLSDEEIFQQLGNIVTNFELYKCDECAVAVMRWLQDNNIEGRVIKLQTAYGEDYILSTRLINQGINSSITLNGIHYAVEVRGKVFDNLSTEGLTYEDWKNDFDSPSGEFIIDYANDFI
ncbi:hypothetical protein NIES4071_37640 [Calothrix sp. NIES-4071]|nr:hypothetical protein NIES4071_37640 [Calothrix sp. NIES-4071]BAZ58081.1 hypothetical protein NIES4105_37570 [Calothrix sp. NIES-4105]